MAYSAVAVANAFIKRAKEGMIADLSPMKLQKLLFLAQSWHLKFKDGEPLLDDTFCRWQYGPVIPAVYHEFKQFGSRSVDRYGTFVGPGKGGGYQLLQPNVPESDHCSWGIIDEIISVYGGYSGVQLSALTHMPGSAWKETGGADGGPMTNDQLRAYIK